MKPATLTFIPLECFAFHFLVPACSADISFLLYNASTGYTILISSVYQYLRVRTLFVNNKRDNAHRDYRLDNAIGDRTRETMIYLYFGTFSNRWIIPSGRLQRHLIHVLVSRRYRHLWRRLRSDGFIYLGLRRILHRHYVRLRRFVQLGFLRIIHESWRLIGINVTGHRNLGLIRILQGIAGDRRDLLRIVHRILRRETTLAV